MFVAGMLLLLTACEDPSVSGAGTTHFIVLDTAGTTIATRIGVPEGFKRKSLDTNSFGYYLRNLNVLPDGSKVHLYNGNLKSNQSVHAAIIDISVGKRDLQQCADAVMRLRAEYLYHQKKYDAIHFHFVSGFDCRYDKWKTGYRVAVQGNRVSWVKTAGADGSYATFLSYMDMVFNYAGTLSLSKELHAINLQEVQIGDVLIRGGAPGHAVIVVDLVENEAGEKRVLLAQSYMPAQQIHVLKNPLNRQLSPWFNLEEKDRIYTPEWVFDKDELKRF